MVPGVSWCPRQEFFSSRARGLSSSSDHVTTLLCGAGHATAPLCALYWHTSANKKIKDFASPHIPSWCATVGLQGSPVQGPRSPGPSGLTVKELLLQEVQGHSEALLVAGRRQLPDLSLYLQGQARWQGWERRRDGSRASRQWRACPGQGRAH